MQAYRHAVREAAQRIAGVTHRTLTALRERRVEQEPAITDRYLGAIEEKLDTFEVKGIRWRAKTLTDRGPHSEESRAGADFLGVLNISLPEFAISKGFLAQAKLLKHGSVDDLDRLKGQCRNMLDRSPASFVFLYSNSRFRVVPAVAVVAGDFDPTGLYSRSAERFFEEHFQCFFGDQTINAPTSQVLEGLKQRYETRVAMRVEARSEI